MTIKSIVTSYHHKYRFSIETSGFLRAGFNSCSAIKAESGDVEHREGGSLIAFKEPGLLTYPDVTLSRGVAQDFDLYMWWMATANAVSDAGFATPGYKRDVDIVQWDRIGAEVRRWTLVNAFPKSFQAGEWNNDNNEVVVEELVLRYDFFKLPID